MKESPPRIYSLKWMAKLGSFMKKPMWPSINPWAMNALTKPVIIRVSMAYCPNPWLSAVFSVWVAWTMTPLV